MLFVSFEEEPKACAVILLEFVIMNHIIVHSKMHEFDWLNLTTNSFGKYMYTAQCLNSECKWTFS